MSCKKYVPVLTILLIGGMLFPGQVQAQWAIGASYEIRDQVPENGFGFRLERSILGKAPVVDLRVRAHFSTFSDNNNNRNLTDYDFGVAGIGGASLGLVKPYVGAGLGSNTVKADFTNTDDVSESNLFWNVLIGAEVNAVPAFKPFVEFRYSQATKEFPTSNPLNTLNVTGSNNRVVFGVSLSF